MYSVSPLISSDSVEIQTAADSIWVVGELANFSWNPSSLLINELINVNQIHIDISLWIYNDITDVFEEKVVVATDVPNTGSASVMLTESLSSKLPNSDTSMFVTYPKIGINSSTSLLRTKRFASNLLRLVGKVAKFGKILAITRQTAAVTARLLCEDFALTPTVPRRRIPPCPCKEQDAGNDDRFEVETSPEYLRKFFHKGSNICFRQANVR